MNAAINQGRYFTTEAAAIGSTAGIGASNPDGVLTFVDGDLTLGPGNPTGQGTLIVTGNLTLDGNFNFNGVIMVLGAGECVSQRRWSRKRLWRDVCREVSAKPELNRCVSGADIRHVRRRHFKHPVQFRCG